MDLPEHLSSRLTHSLSSRLTRLRRSSVRLRRSFTRLPWRARLTVRHHGVREAARRSVTYPLPLTPARQRLGLAARNADLSAPAREWYLMHGRPVAVVIPTYGDTRLLASAAGAVRASADPQRVRLIVADDGSAEEHRAALARLSRQLGFLLVQGEAQRGFAANCNRGIAAASAGEDVILLNTDVTARPGWLEALQHAAYTGPAGITGPQLRYPDGSIQCAGIYRHRHDRDWFEHRHRGRSARTAQVAVMQPALAVTGACMYLTRAALDDLGLLDEAYEMAFEDIDYCLRAWNAGHRVLYTPAAVLEHDEGATRGRIQGERELRSQAEFWSRWRDWFDRRDVRDADGGLRVVYVSGGGRPADQPRVPFTHLTSLADRSHDAQLWTLERGGPDRSYPSVPVRRFGSFAQLRDALAPLDAIKVATGWESADWVWESSVTHGIPVYWVDEFPPAHDANPAQRTRALASLRPDFDYVAGSQRVADRLERRMSIEAAAVGPAPDGRVDPGALERHYRRLADRTRQRSAPAIDARRSRPDRPLSADLT